MAHSCCHALTQDQSLKYFNRAKINAFFCFLFFLLSISGVTLPWYMGLGLAFFTAWMMQYSGGEYYKSAYQALKNKTTNMNTLVALSTLIALSYSIVLCCFPQFFPLIAVHYHFAEIAMILGIINVGRGFRFKAEYEVKQRTQDQFKMFQKYQPEFARRIKKKSSRIKSTDIKVGDILEIQPNARFPVEGVIISINNATTRHSWIDEKNITGESKLVKKGIADSVLTGTRNTEHTIRIRATVDGKENNLRKLLYSFEMAPKSETGDSELINTISRYFIPSILGIAFITGGAWLWLAPVAVSAIPAMLQSVLSVLLCACPCALGLAAPMSISISIDTLLSKGILVKKASSFEKAGSIDTIIFDKTGTLTAPVVDTQYFPELDYAASLEKYHTKSHPIATAIIKAGSAAAHRVSNSITEDQGMTGLVEGIAMIVGSLEYCKNKNAVIARKYSKQAKKLSDLGQTTVFIVCDLQCVGVIGLKHQVSDDAKSHIDALKSKGIKIGLLTGDKKGPANAIAEQLGIDKKWVWYGCSAQQKLEKIKHLKKTRKGVVMVGDGMNDIAACEAADIGIAIHAWTNAAVECDVALQGSIGDIIRFLEVAKLVTRNIKQNLGWTFFYNTVVLMGATGLFYPMICCACSPIIASAFMACSSIVVIMNARRLPVLIDKVLQDFEGALGIWKKPDPVLLPPQARGRAVIFEKASSSRSPSSFYPHPI